MRDYPDVLVAVLGIVTVSKTIALLNTALALTGLTEVA